MRLKNFFEITGIGSMPHESEKAACDVIFPNFRRIPYWPQLVHRSYLEGMMVQFTERMPGIEVDAEAKKVFFNRKRDIRAEIDELNIRHEAGDLEYFSFSEDYAAGFYEYLYRLRDHDNTMLDYLKGHITGPVSFAFTVTDEDGIPIFFDKEICEAVVKTLASKARWQAVKLKNIFKDIVIFIDEPSLALFKHTASGSRIRKEDIAAYINRVVDAVHVEGCYAGLHCCGDADWDLVLSTNIDIISFDVYNYGRAFTDSSESIRRFLERDGIIAWGIVPTAEEALRDNPETLTEKLQSHIDVLVSQGIEKRRIVRSSLITPSCGCGALENKDAEDVISHCVAVSQLARAKIAG